MSTGTDAPARRASHSLGSLARPAVAETSSAAFPWLVTATSTWILVGLFVDGWFHINSPGLETFFTPWHALLYSGVAAALVVHLGEQLRAGGLPRGYRLSLVGGLVVSLAGLADLVWHTVLGVEADLAALLSPPHLLLITAGTLVFAGPLRAALAAPGPLGLPAALSAGFVVTGLAFFTQYANPLTHLYPVADGAAARSADVLELRQVAGVGGVVLFAVLVAGAAAVLRARGPLPAGALALAVGVPCLAMTTLRSTYVLVPALVLAALAVELLGRRLGPVALAAAASALVTLGWAITLAATRELDWGVELMTGSVCSAAAAGVLTGWLVRSGARAAA